MKFNSDKHEEQTSVLCGGQNIKYRAEHKGNREDGYSHAEGLYPWRHQSLGSPQLLDSNICSEEPDLGEDIPAYCRALNPVTFRALCQLGRASVIQKLSGWMGCW